MHPAYNDGQITMVPLEELRGFSSAIKYFDNDKKLYMCPNVYQQYLDKTLERLDFLTLKYCESQKPIEEIANEIIAEMKR